MNNIMFEGAMTSILREVAKSGLPKETRSKIIDTWCDAIDAVTEKRYVPYVKYVPTGYVYEDWNHIYRPTQEAAASVIEDIILKEMKNNEFGICKVAKLYEKLNVPTGVTDWKLGWNDSDRGDMDISYDNTLHKWHVVLPDPHVV